MEKISLTEDPLIYAKHDDGCDNIGNGTSINCKLGTHEFLSKVDID